MIRKVLAPFVILLAFQALIQQGSSQSFCNVYMPFETQVFYPCEANGAAITYSATEIPELATATAFTVSFYYYNNVSSWPTNSNNFIFLFELTNTSPDSDSSRWLQAYYSAANVYVNHQTDSAGTTLVNHTASPAIILPYDSWVLIHVEFDASASEIYLFCTDFATFLYQNTVTRAGATVTPMGSNAKIYFSGISGLVDMSHSCGQIARAIFAPYSMKVAPYDTFAFQFNVSAISWYRFDNTGSPGTAQDYTTTAPANIGGSQPNFPSYTLGQEENGLSFSATNRIILPTNMNYRPYPPAAYYAVQTFTFWLNIPTQTSNPAIIFTSYDSTNSIKYQIALDTTNTVKIFIVRNSYFTSNLTIPASTWTLLIVSLKTSEVSVFMAPSGYWQTTFPTNQSLLHKSTDTEYLGSTTSSFVGYLREFRVFSDSSLVNFVSTEFSSCLSGCTYGIGFYTLLNNQTSPICLDSSTAPTCPSGQYLFSTNNNCYNCYYQCSACTGLSATDCDPCSAPQELYLQPNDYCSTTCPTTYYPDTPTRTCKSCVANCDVCSNAASCTTCTSPYYLSHVDSLCYSSCPTGTYLNSGECYACPSNCNECFSGTVCTTCATNYYLSQVDNTCYSTCPTATYTNSNYCSACPSDCNACSSGTVCTTCASTYYLSQVNSLCYSSCPTGTYLNSTDCSACPSNCDVCSNGTVCTTCASSYYLSQVDHSCYSPCPAGTYLNSPDCIACLLANCNACSSGTVCTACASNYYLSQVNFLCYGSCPSSTYTSGTNCFACSSNCNACSSGTVCTTCASTYYLSQVNSLCYSSCPTGTYLNSTDCSACPSNCDLCSNGTVCTTCASSYYLSQVNFLCYSSCPSSTYISGTSCFACSSNCNTCSSSTACSACQTNYYLYNNGTTQSCYSSCPTGYLVDSATNTCTTSCGAGEYNNGSGVCAQCVQYCTSCSDATSCNSCSGGRSFKNGACVLPSSCVASNCTLALNLKLTPDPLGFELVFNQQVQPIIDSLNTTLVVQLGDTTCSSSDYYLQAIDSESAIIRFPTDQPIPSATILYCEVNLPSTLTVNFTQVNTNASITVDQYTPLSASESSAVSILGSVNNYGGKVATSLIVVSQISVMSTGTLLFAAFGSDMIQMYRYVNVRYPENCLAVFNASLTSSISITLPIDLSSFQSAAYAIGYYDNIEDGESLERYDVNRYFLNNFQDCISTIILLLILCGLLHFALKYKKKLNRRIAYILDKAYIFLCWNFTIASAFSYSIKLYFYSTVYMWYIDTNTANGIVNIVACVIMIPMSIALLVYAIKYLKKAKKEELREPEKYGLTHRYKCLYEGIKHDTASQKFYIPVLVIRAMIFGLLLSVMRYATLPQVILFCIMNTGFLLYLIIARASEITMEMMAQVVTECVITGISYSILALAVIDADNPENQGIRSRVGMGIVVFNFILTGVQAIISGRATFMMLKLLIRGIINARRRRLSVAPLKSEQTNRENLSLFGNGLGITDLVAAQESARRPTIDIPPSSDLLDGTKLKESALPDGSSLVSPLTPLQLRTIARKRESKNMVLNSPENSPMNSNNGGASPLLRALARRTTVQRSKFDNVDVLDRKISIETTNFNLKEENEGDETFAGKENPEKIVD